MLIPILRPTSFSVLNALTIIILTRNYILKKLWFRRVYRKHVTSSIPNILTTIPFSERIIERSQLINRLFLKLPTLLYNIYFRDHLVGCLENSESFFKFVIPSWTLINTYLKIKSKRNPLKHHMSEIKNEPPVRKRTRNQIVLKL